MMEIEVFRSTKGTRKQLTALKCPTLRTTCILESSNSKERSDLGTKVSEDAETSIRVSIPGLRVLRFGFFFFFHGFPAPKPLEKWKGDGDGSATARSIRSQNQAFEDAETLIRVLERSSRL